jgi:hypothetical protein
MAYKARLQLDSDLSSTTLPGKKNKGVFSSHLKFFHPITLNVWHVYGVLNVDGKKLIAQFCWKPRDESFKPN